jgi:toxin ParE1/3/4
MQVVITHGAEQDILDLYEWLLTMESQDRADQLLAELQEQCRSLSQFPERGRKVPEMVRLGESGVLETMHKPWRIIYEVFGGTVYIHAIVDSRRDVQAFLQRRLLR